MAEEAVKGVAERFSEFAGRWDGRMMDCARYGAGNVLVLGCSYYRLMRGETDEVVQRVRSDAAEEAVIGVVNAAGVEPDFFADLWNVRKCLVPELTSVLVFGKASDRERFEKAAVEYDTDDVCIVGREENSWFYNCVAAWFSERWEKAAARHHEMHLSVFRDAKERHPDWVERICFIVVDGKDGVEEAGDKVKELVGGEVPYGIGSKDGKVYIGFICDTAEDADRLVEGAVGGHIEAALAFDEDAVTNNNTVAEMGAELLAKLDMKARIDAKIAEEEAKKAEAAKANG